jgi:hypothetical protein
LFPEATTIARMFAAVWRRLSGTGAMEVALRLDPALGSAHPYEREHMGRRVCDEALATLLQGALLEQGATPEHTLGEAALVLRMGDERVAPVALVRLLGTDVAAGRAAFDGWASRFE